MAKHKNQTLDKDVSLEKTPDSAFGEIFKGRPSLYYSREACDFGRGLYLGDMEEQPQGLIAGYKNHMFYVIDYDISGLKVKRFQNDYAGQVDWALYIAYNRKNEFLLEYDSLKNRYEYYEKYYDVIIGTIADDSMIPTLTEFFRGDLSDLAMLECLRFTKPGNQYVLKTEEACDRRHLKITSARKLNDQEIKYAVAQTQQRRDRMSSELDRIRRKYRRSTQAKYFDEIIEEWAGDEA